MGKGPVPVVHDDHLPSTQSYLARINYEGELKVSSGMLSALQEAHLLTVPFENLDIHIGRRIVLDLIPLFRKIVTMRRGGFCYELNALFHWLLSELGFHATLVMGRVFDRRTRSYGPEFDHMLILVDVDGRRWLVDVGFGDFSAHPLELALNHPQTDLNGQFLIAAEDNTYFRVSRFSPTEKRHIPQYIFSPKERQIAEFSEMCLYHQTSPESHFTRNRICSIATPAGRITLTDEKLIVTDAGVRSESLITNEQDFLCALDQYFHITLDHLGGPLPAPPRS